MSQKKEFVIIHVYNGVVQTVGTNLPNIVVIIADEDKNADMPASLSSFSKEDLYHIETPEEMFTPEETDSEFDKENKEEFLEQLKQVVFPEVVEWVVLLGNNHDAKPDQIKDGYLAYDGKIMKYDRGEAIKKARFFGGKAKKFIGSQSA